MQSSQNAVSSLCRVHISLEIRSCPVRLTTAAAERILRVYRFEVLRPLRGTAHGGHCYEIKIYPHPLALLCAALACSILAGCGGSTASSSEAPSSASSSASSAASGEDLPDSTTRADTSGLNPGDFDENSIFSITGTTGTGVPAARSNR